MPLSFSIAAAACWKPGTDASIYEKFPVALHVITDEVPPLPQQKLPTKRRLSSWCKAMLVCGESCCGDDNAIPTIFASKHGEWAREVGMLIDYTRGEGVSQGGFSLSVHNVAASLFSISQENRQPYSAIAAGDETFEAGLLEAVMHLEKYERVLLVVGDEQAPKEFPDVVSVPQVHALMLTRGNDFAIESGGSAKALSANDFFSFVNILANGKADSVGLGMTVSPSSALPTGASLSRTQRGGDHADCTNFSSSAISSGVEGSPRSGLRGATIKVSVC